MKRSLGLIVLLAPAVLLAGRARSDSATPAPSVVVTKAKTECFSSVIRATGYAVPRSLAVVMFNAPGFRISEVSVKAGDKVAVGDKVFVAVPAGSGDAPAAAQVPIKSLASGTILQVDASVGTLTSATAGPLATIAVDGDMEVLVDIPSVHVLDLAAGQVAHVSIDDGREFGGHVRVVPLEINRTSQVGQARISTEGGEPLKMGRFVHVAIDSSRSCGIGVPLAALLQESDGIRVQVVKNKSIETRLVTLGLRSDSMAEVKGNVAEGDLVVADAGTSLRDGDKVSPILSDLQEAR